MPLSTASARRWVASACVLGVSALAACSDKHSSGSAQVASKLTVKGVVFDEDNKPVANANVAVGGATVVTDAAGGYVIEPNGLLGGAGVFNVTAPGFGSRSQEVFYDFVGTMQNFTLRKHSTSQTVALPTDQSGVATVTFAANANSGVTLSIPFGALATEAGAAAQGNVDAALTFWNPDEALTNTPSPMLGYSNRDYAGGSNELLSYGMVDIELRQNGQALKVAANQNLQLTFNVPPAFQDDLNDTIPTDATAPQLWSVDANVGAWVLEGSMANGRVTWDAATKTLKASLPHLSAWNLDGVNKPNGCVTGTMVDCKGAVVANTTAWMWTIGKGSISHTPISGGADGKFCSSVLGAGALSKKTVASGDAYVWYSLPKAPSATSQCNPTKIASYSELCPGQSASDLVCRGADSDSRQDKWDAGIASCKTPSVSLKMCGYCAGAPKPSGRCMVRQGDGQPYAGPSYTQGACTDLGKVMIPTAACGNSNTVDPCAGKGDNRGKACKTDADCCPSKSLECADGACVPKTNGI